MIHDFRLVAIVTQLHKKTFYSRKNCSSELENLSLLKHELESSIEDKGLRATLFNLNLWEGLMPKCLSFTREFS